MCPHCARNPHEPWCPARGNLSLLDTELSAEEREGLAHTLSNSGLCKALKAANTPVLGLGGEKTHQILNYGNPEQCPKSPGFLRAGDNRAPGGRSPAQRHPCPREVWGRVWLAFFSVSTPGLRFSLGQVSAWSKFFMAVS